MRHIVTVLLLIMVVAGAAFGQGTRIAATYSYPLLPGTALDSLLWQGAHVRAVGYSDDADGDGKSDIAITNYAGVVHVFETVGNDSIALVWTSPPAVIGGGSTPREVIFGDLDGDGLQEVIYQVSGDGIQIFEWDGVVGSDNYGTIASQTIAAPFLASASGSTEYMEVTDVDGDGVNELLVAYNSSPDANDRYYIISPIGGWSTDNPGFSSFTVEYEGIRTSPASVARGLNGGSPYALIPANFDGAGNSEILIHNWNIKNVSPMTVPSANTYVLSDTTNGKQNLQLSIPDDHVSLFGGAVTDIDNDGREEVYLASWYGSNGTASSGKVHMIHYDAGSNLSEIDSATNTVTFDLRSVTGPPDPGQSYSANLLGYAYGDLDGNGKPNIYFSGIYFGGGVGFNIVTMEFQGGDKTNPANWTASMIYDGNSGIYTSITITDSLGVVDTTRVAWAAQVADMWGKNTDFDKDGFQDLILPMQGWFDAHVDSITTTTYTWNTGNSSYDTSIVKTANPKRWVLRILEGTVISGVEAKDLTVIMPDEYRLEQNYPNPFNPSTTISFYLPIRDAVSVKIYDIVGKEVRTLINNQLYPSGTSQITWDGRTNAGTPAASGTYFYSLIYGNFKQTKKMMLVK